VHRAWLIALLAVLLYLLWGAGEMCEWWDGALPGPW
jgi:hypothetical protein